MEKLKLVSKFFKFVMNSMLGIIQLKLQNKSNEKSENFLEKIDDWIFEERLSKEFESIGFFISSDRTFMSFLKLKLSSLLLIFSRSNLIKIIFNSI